MTRYHGPDTSDKRPDENWFEYWDRKRHEAHGPDCECLVCANEERLDELQELLLPNPWRDDE